MIQYQPSKDYEYHSDDFSKPVGKIRARKYPQGLLKKTKSPVAYYINVVHLRTSLNFKKQRTHAHSVFV